MCADIKRTGNFLITGAGDSPEWAMAEALNPARMAGPNAFRTIFKLLYSETGIYFLAVCEDRALTGENFPDFGDLYRSDVVELFLRPDEKTGLYFEIEFSPWGSVLPLLVANNGASFYGWLPFHYGGPRRVVHRVSQLESLAQFGVGHGGWIVEALIPYALFEGVCLPPVSGTVWRANLCRIDYDAPGPTRWAWASKCGVEFHNYNHYEPLCFE